MGSLTRQSITESGERRQWLHEQTVGSAGRISRGVADEHRVGRVAALCERPAHGAAERTGHGGVGDEQPDHGAADQGHGVTRIADDPRSSAWRVKADRP
jgi:hypothetical protein